MANLDRAGNKVSTFEQQRDRESRNPSALTEPVAKLQLLNFMNRNLRLALATWLVTGLMMMAVRAAETATVKRNRVNVRGQATQNSEVITQLKKGETVVVLEEISPGKPKKGEPARWARIQLPMNTPVWVFAPYIEMANKTVNIKRLNIRAGPGEKYSVLGRIDRGTAI